MGGRMFGNLIHGGEANCLIDNDCVKMCSKKVDLSKYEGYTDTSSYKGPDEAVRFDHVIDKKGNLVRYGSNLNYQQSRTRAKIYFEQDQYMSKKEFCLERLESKCVKER